VFALLRLLAGPDEAEAFAERYRAGGMGYGEVKKRLAELFEETFGPARERRLALENDPDTVEDALRDGARRARAVAVETMVAVRDACGIVTA
jgi:tryptophanyl-tRNA synthetase